MAYVTAGTYYEDEILQMELIILKVTLLKVWRYADSLFDINNPWRFSFYIILLSVYFTGTEMEPLPWNSRLLAEALLPDAIDEHELRPTGAADSTGRLCSNGTSECLDYIFWKHSYRQKPLCQIRVKNLQTWSQQKSYI